MAFMIKLIAVVGIVSLANARSTVRQSGPPIEIPDYTPQNSDEAAAGSYQLPPQLSLSFELPREAPAPVPFFSPEPSTILKAPEYIDQPDYYQAPIPSQDLVAPIETQWNPDNDPKLYYEVPAVLTKQELPTNLYPKKYNKDIHSKDKPLSSKPKQEITLEPINESAYVLKQKELHKTFDKLAKQENQKQIQVDNSRNPKGFSFSNSEDELEEAATIIHNNDHNSFSSELTSSLGHPAHGSQGERVDFHMVGHDGPFSYKWGYDTGKGHNRQFRFEERNKEGIVKGHYGFYDKEGKLQMVNYDSHPHAGFHAESNPAN